MMDCCDHISRPDFSLNSRAALLTIFPRFSCTSTHCDKSATEDMIEPAGRTLSRFSNGNAFNCPSTLACGNAQSAPGLYAVGLVTVDFIPSGKKIFSRT